MPIFLEDLRYAPQNVSGDIDYLNGNIFQKITVEIDFRVQTFINTATGQGINFQDALLATSITQDWIVDRTLTGRFRHFNVGDEINVANSGGGSNDGTFIITEKLNDSTIRVIAGTSGTPGTIPLTQQTETAATISLIQESDGMSFDFGLIENNEATNFLSKVDGNTMRWEYDGAGSGISSSYVDMVPMLPESWQLGGVQVKNTTTSGQRDQFEYHFTIKQIFYIHPFFLHTQILDILAGKKPKYFDLFKCLKHVFRIRAFRSLTDPNVYQELVFDLKEGNTGWFDEEFNAGNPNFTLGAVTYSTGVGKLTRDNVVTVDVSIDDITGGSYLPHYFVLHFILLPETPSQYQNIRSPMDFNYMWDRAEQTAGAAAVNGWNYGSSQQAIKTFTATVAGSTATLQFLIDFGSSVKGMIDALTDKRYLLCCEVVSAGMTAATNNYVTVLIDINDIGIEIPDASVAVTNKAWMHNQTTGDTSQTIPTIKVEDEVVIDSLIEIDQASPLTDLQINTLRCGIVAKKTGEEVELLMSDFDLTAAAEVAGVRVINETRGMPFKMASTEIRKFMKMYRSTADDSGTLKAYRVQWPFLMRWEYWEQLLLQTLPADFFDTAEDFNGYNNDWIRISDLSGWALYYRTEIEVESGNFATTKTTDTAITVGGYLENSSNWTPVSIDTYDDTTPLTVGGVPFIDKTINTKVVASFEWAGAGTKNVADLYAVIRIIPQEGGTYEDSDTLSSIYSRQSVSLLTSNSDTTTGAGLVVMASPGTNQFTATCYIDKNKLPTGIINYTISASINEKTITDPGEVLTLDCEVLDRIDFDPPVVPKEENPFKKCCYKLVVFASTSDTDNFKNDSTSFLRIFPKRYTFTMYLQKMDATTGVWSNIATLNNTTYGTYYAQGFATKGTNDLMGFKLDWRTVLLAHSTGKYRVRFSCTEGNLDSEEYCLEEFSTLAADMTVRITYQWNSVIGDRGQTVVRDFAGIEWWNQIRLTDSIFGYKKGQFETEKVRYQSGKLRSVSKKYTEEYKLEIRKLPPDLLDVLLYDVLAADEILISDYNSQNAFDYVEVSCEINGGYEPDYSRSRPEPSVTLTFADKYDNRRKLYS